MPDTSQDSRYLTLTAEIVGAHVAHNTVPGDALPDLIESIYRALTVLETGSVAVSPEKPRPAVPIKNSVFPSYIVCLEDGRKMKMLKRHLQAFNLTPAQYRERWGLPANYPMTAPDYAKRRSVLAKKIGLGRPKSIADKEVVVTLLPPRRAKGSRW